MMKRSLSSLVLVIGALWSFSGSAQAALFGDDEAHKRIDQLSERLTQLEAVMNERANNTEQRQINGLMDLSSTLDAIRADISTLRGQIEVLNHGLNETQKRQRDLYTDLDSRLRALEPRSAGQAAPSPGFAGQPPAPVPSSAPAMSTPSPVQPATTPTSAQRPGFSTAPATPVVPGQVAAAGLASSQNLLAEEKAYNDAMAFFKRGDYPGAARAFTSFINTYPRSPQASQAQYWIGNARFAQRDYRGAVEAQNKLLQNYPDSSKAPDALLNMASAQLEMGDRETAKLTLQSLISRYPTSDAASKARQRMK